MGLRHMRRRRFNAIRSIARMILGRRLPITSGLIKVAGLNGPVRIDRDRHGVPYIEAGNDEDAWFGLGFCHGQDRAGQLEIALRMVRGTLSAVAGEDTLPLDRLSRRIGLRRTGEVQLRAQDADIQRQIEAYCRGINAALSKGAKRPAPEFVLLGCPPTPWEAADVQGLIVLVCFALASNWDIELLRLRMLSEDGPEALEALEAPYPEWLPASMNATEYSAATLEGIKTAESDSLRLLRDEIGHFQSLFGLVGGSNAWAVSSARSATGRPILANDPHMMPAAPSQWYLASMRTPQWCSVGASFVGVPGQVNGHNGHAAWGITAAHVDHTDLFFEELGPDGITVRDGDGYVPCQLRHEVIEVKGGREVVEEVLITPRGPVFSPAVEGCRHVLSMAATWLAPRPNRGLLAIHKARTVDDFRAVFQKAAVSNGGVVFVAEDGAIGMQVSAEVPNRREPHGHLPSPGWDPRFAWDGIIAAEQMPRRIDPPNGVVAMANNRPTEPGTDAPYLGVDWLDGYRLRRIVEALESRSDWSVDSMLALQRDHRSIPWQELSPIALNPALGQRDADARRAQQMLAAWDGEVAPDSVAATLFEFWLSAMIRRVVRAKAPRSAPFVLGKGDTALLPYNLVLTRRVGHLVSLLHRQPAGWFGPAVTWDDVVAATLAGALQQLEAQLGPPGRRWQWGRVRPMTLRHPFSDKPPVDRLFDIGPVWAGGDATTIPQAGVDLADTAANPTSAATMRLVVDVGNWDASRYVVLGGQSGNPFSPHYDDHVGAWERGEGFPIPWTHEKARAVSVTTLELEPSLDP